MKKHPLRLKSIAACMIFSLTFLTQPAANACTGIMLHTEEGTTVNGRTLEFGTPIDTSIVVIPRDHQFIGGTTLGDGKKWSSKYAFVGANAFNALSIIDGINEKGLAVGLFYFPDYAGYSQTTPQNQSISMSATDFASWLLTQFATVDEARAAIEKGEAAISPTLTPGFPPVPQPAHYVIYDKSGKSIVVEPIDGKLIIHDNPLGVFTNSPTFDWHMTNISNYIALKPLNVPPVEVDGTTLKALGQGSGMVGLPGDFTPPSRFVRAAAFSATAIPSKNTSEGISQVFHILNNFDIPVGIAREEDNGVLHTDYTMLTVARDPQNLRYYYKTYDDQTIRMVDLSKFDLNAKTIKKLSTKGTQPFVDMSDKVK